MTPRKPLVPEVPPPGGPRAMVPARLPLGLVARLESWAAEVGLTRSRAVEILLTQALDHLDAARPKRGRKGTP